MAKLLVDDRDQAFVLHEMLEMEKLCNSPLFAEHSREVFDMALNEALKLAMSELVPTNKEGDEEGCTYDPDTQTVKVPECYKAPYRMLGEGGWIVMSEDPEVGGQGFPLTLGAATSEIFYAACFPIYGEAIISHGAGKLVELYGTDEQKGKYLEGLYSGKWGGTMCLTEANAGSDVGALRTKATENADGSYLISGTKIFITAGEQNLTENIIHMVLARVEGDSAGTRGLSVFIVPKYLVNDDGSLGDKNDVVCSGIEHKMGQHGLSTVTLNFGEDGKCIGYLLGERSKGIRVMFNLMNEQRLLIGVQGLSMSSKAFLNAVDFAKNRIQGPPISDPNAASVPIIQHPDIKERLLSMKAYVEGCRALIYFAYYCIDQTHITKGEEKLEWQGLVDILTPVAKAYNSYRAWEITGSAVECAGGYGYCSDYPFEQIARDCKVTSIYEGTNGIQAMDLMFRKLIRNKLVDFENLISKIDKTIAEAKKIENIRSYAEIVEKVKAGLVEVVHDQMALVKEGKIVTAYYNATAFLEAMGDVILGWIHLWQLTIAYPKLMELVGDRKENEMEAIIDESGEAAFYSGKVFGSRFYIGSILKKTFGKFEQLRSDENADVEIFEKSFVS